MFQLELTQIRHNLSGQYRSMPLKTICKYCVPLSYRLIFSMLIPPAVSNLQIHLPDSETVSPVLPLFTLVWLRTRLGARLDMLELMLTCPCHLMIKDRYQEVRMWTRRC